VTYRHRFSHTERNVAPHHRDRIITTMITVTSLHSTFTAKAVELNV